MELTRLIEALSSAAAYPHGDDAVGPLPPGGGVRPGHRPVVRAQPAQQHGHAVGPRHRPRRRGTGRELKPFK